MKAWDRRFVKIINEATNEINAVVDDLALSPWRAVTRSDQTPANEDEKLGGVEYYDWTPDEQSDWMLLNKNHGWLVLEGWITNSVGSKGGEAQFRRSRADTSLYSSVSANTNIVQGLVTPWLTNNIGSIAFEWRASGVGHVEFAVERTSAGAASTWVPILTKTNAALEGYENVFVGTDYPGRLRIRVCEGTQPDAEFKIDTLVVRDYPPADEASWKSYNTLITAAQTNRAFEPTLLDKQTAYLNNNPTNGVPPPEVLDAHPSYVQTPKVGTGIGEIAFWYRVWDAAGGNATISLQSAPHEGVPEGQWKVLTNLVVLSTQTNYTYFTTGDAGIYEPDDKVLRIYCSTNGNRVCIDNVLMAEPVRAGYEFRTITLLPDQPLVGQPPGLEVEVGRFIMNPTNLQVFVTYQTGTNIWGYTNWWSYADWESNPQTIELEEVPGAPRKYRMPEGSTLPATAIDDVVQFFVWGSHSGIDLQKQKPIVQDAAAFRHPSWYHPVNLNSNANLKAQGWSPYYFVYSCPPGSVWVNEIRYYVQTVERTNEFIEIIGPAGASLGKWTLQMVDTSDTVLDNKRSVVSNSFVLANTYLGWGFLVWGDLAFSNRVGYVALPPGSLNREIATDGGIRVIRSNGAWEDRVAWGSASISTLVNQKGYRYAGTKTTTVSLSLTTPSGDPAGETSDDFTWGQAVASPGAPNDSQVLVEQEVPLAFFMIYSAIGPNGAHSAGATPLAAIEIAPGGSTNIVYTANEWYRIGSMATNGVAIGAAVGCRAYTQQFANAQADVSNNVTFVDAAAQQTGLTNSVPTAWAKSYYDNEADALADASIATDYLLGLAPTNAYTIGFGVKSIVVADGTVTVTVKLTDGDQPLDTTINGALKLYGKAVLTAPAWSGIGAAVVNNANFNASGEYALPPFDPGSNTFFRAVIE